MSRVLELYRGYEVLAASPEYGAQFAYAWRVSDEGSFQFTASVDEAKAEIDAFVHDLIEYEKDKRT